MYIDMNIEEKFMREALKQAKKAASMGEMPVGAVIVHNGKIIARGYNKRETKKNALLHAEVTAIDKACRRLGGWRLPECEMYVTLEPCPMCAAAIGWAQIRRIVIGAADPKRGYTTMYAHSPFHPRAVVLQGILADECAAVITDFFRRRR